MTSPWAILGAVVTAFALLIGGYTYGRHDGKTLAEAAQLREERIATLTYEKAQKATAEEIAKLEIKHVTYQTRIERETREVPVYRSADCNHTDDGLRIINAALTNGAIAPGDSKLSEVLGSVGRPELRSNVGEAGEGGGDLLQVPRSGGDE